MQNVEELNIKLNEEFEKEVNRFKDDFNNHKSNELALMGLVINFFDTNEGLISDELANKILEHEEPLKYLCEVFNDYVFMDNLFFDVYEDAFLNDYEGQEDIRSLFFYEDDGEDDEELEDDNPDDEGFIHDNEDC